MEAWENYFEVMEKVVAQVKNTQKDNIKKAAKILADTTEKGGLIYGFGTMMHFGELLPRLIIVLCWNKVQQAVLKLQKVITLKICMKLEK